MKRFAVMVKQKKHETWCREHGFDDLNEAYNFLRKVECSHEKTCGSKCSFEWKVVDDEV